jgi:hypothetical protein
MATGNFTGEDQLLAGEGNFPIEGMADIDLRDAIVQQRFAGHASPYKDAEGEATSLCWDIWLYDIVARNPASIVKKLGLRQGLSMGDGMPRYTPVISCANKLPLATSTDVYDLIQDADTRMKIMKIDLRRQLTYVGVSAYDHNGAYGPYQGSASRGLPIWARGKITVVVTQGVGSKTMPDEFQFAYFDVPDTSPEDFRGTTRGLNSRYDGRIPFTFSTYSATHVLDRIKAVHTKYKAVTDDGKRDLAAFIKQKKTRSDNSILSADYEQGFKMLTALGNFKRYCDRVDAKTPLPNDPTKPPHELGYEIMERLNNRKVYRVLGNEDCECFDELVTAIADAEVVFSTAHCRVLAHRTKGETTNLRKLQTDIYMT